MLWRLTLDQVVEPVNFTPSLTNTEGNINPVAGCLDFFLSSVQPYACLLITLGQDWGGMAPHSYCRMLEVAVGQEKKICFCSKESLFCSAIQNTNFAFIYNFNYLLSRCFCPTLLSSKLGYPPHIDLQHFLNYNNKSNNW